MSRQDRQGVRTPADVERKYNFGQFVYDQKKKDEEQNQRIEQANNNASNNIALLSKELEKFSKKTSKEISKITREIENIQLSASDSLYSFSLKLSEIEATDQAQTEAIKGINLLLESLRNSVNALSQIVSELSGQSGSGMLVYAETESLSSDTIYADKTFTEIDEAINTGSVVRVKLLCSNIDDFVYLYLASHLPGVEVTFCGYFNGLPVTLQLQADDTSTS